MKPLDWGFICGELVALEERLLDRRAIMHVYNAASVDERRSRVRASLLFFDIPPGEKPLDQIQPHYDNFVLWVMKIAPDDRIGWIFLLGRCWELFRELAKEKWAKIAPVAIARGEGSVREMEIFKPLHRVVNGEATEPWMEPFAQAAEQIAGHADASEDPAGFIDRICDTKEAVSIRNTADALASGTLSTTVKTWLDLRAGLSILRARQIGWEVEPLLAEWRDNGFQNSGLVTLARDDASTWPIALDFLGLPKADVFLQEQTPAVRIARAIDDRILELAVYAALGLPAGPEMVFMFLWALRNESLNLKLALSAAESGMPEDRVAEELRAMRGEIAWQK